MPTSVVLPAVRLTLGFAAVLISVTACSNYSDPYVIDADSAAVAPGPAPNTTTVRVFGYVSDGCGELLSVQRWQRGDTLVRRLWGKSRVRTLCSQKQVLVTHEDLLGNTPARTIPYVVLQRDGSQFTKLITVPAP